MILTTILTTTSRSAASSAGRWTPTLLRSRRRRGRHVERAVPTALVRVPPAFDPAAGACERDTGQRLTIRTAPCARSRSSAAAIWPPGGGAQGASRASQAPIFLADRPTAARPRQETARARRS